jgi:hypothetical protein
MDEIDVVQYVQHVLRERHGAVVDVLAANGVKDMEHYAHLMGELAALTHVNQELSDMLERQETLDA